jgi:hypothetical protein
MESSPGTAMQVFTTRLLYKMRPSSAIVLFALLFGPVVTQPQQKPTKDISAGRV